MSIHNNVVVTHFWQLPNSHLMPCVYTFQRTLYIHIADSESVEFLRISTCGVVIQHRLVHKGVALENSVRGRFLTPCTNEQCQQMQLPVDVLKLLYN